MFKRGEKLLSLLLAFLMLLNTASISIASEITNIFDGTQSGWAETELKQAHSLELTYPGVMNNYRKNITREEFSTLAVKLYEAFTAKKAITGKNPFLDTNNEEVLKAYNLGIVKGISNTEFAPKKDITRQEICVMIYRALAVSLDKLTEDKILELPFSDKDKVASWAIKEVRFAYTYGIMKGMGNNKLEPILNTTREQAIVLLKRTYASFSDDENLDIIITPEDSIGVIETYKPELKVINPKLNYENMKVSNLFFPDYDERLDLYVATSETKPNSAPERIQNTVAIVSPNILPIVIPKPILPIENLDPIILPIFTTSTKWTSSSYGAFIDVEGNATRWFSYNLKNASNAKKIVWQVSTTPYNGFKEGWKTPRGLVGSGETSLSSKEFTIDFKNLTIKNDSKFQLINNQLQLQRKYKPIPQEKIVYYVRAFPVDGVGNPIGDPGDGLALTYGIRTENYLLDKKIEESFQLWTPISSDIVNGPEFFDFPELRNEITVLPNNSERLFHFRGIDASYKKVIIQVSSKPFSSDGRWPNTKDLIYQEEYDIPIANLYQNYPNSIYLDFSKFAKPASQMKEGDYTDYYIRGVALKESNEPGFYDDYYSTPVKAVYRLANPVNYFSDSPYTKTVILDKALPDLSIKNYVPTKWQDSDYLNHYYVYRQPKWNEIKSKFKNSSTGYILYPYSHYVMNPSLGVSSPQQYENEIISKVLNVGTKVYFPPPNEENKAWYQQLFEGIVNFFKDIAKVLKDLYTQIQVAYENLKNSAIMFVVNLCPVDGLKGPFKTALEAWVNYGLMSVGIPPSLPTFDELTDASMDYFAQVVLTEAGIPENEWTKDLVKDVAEGMAEEIDKASSYADANPIDSPFLKLDPDFLYRPAYVDIEVKNDKTVSSISGTFDLHVLFELGHYDRTGLNLVVETNYVAGSGPALLAESKYREHFESGLNGYSVDYKQGDKALYDVFYPKISIKVPQLMRGEKTNIRVYLEPVTSSYNAYSNYWRYPEGETVKAIDFENIYFNNGSTSKYTKFKLYGHFPTAREYLLMSDNMLYLDPKTEYFFKEEHYAKIGDLLEKPVSKAWTR